MDRSVLFVGAVIIAGMLLVPPFETGAVDQIGDALQGERVTAIEYAPIWSGDGMQDGSISWNRLLLQILAVALGTVGVAYYRQS